VAVSTYELIKIDLVILCQPVCGAATSVLLPLYMISRSN